MRHHLPQKTQTIFLDIQNDLRNNSSEKKYGMRGTHHCRDLVTIFILIVLSFNATLYSQENLGRQTIARFDATHHVLKPDAPYLAKSIPMAEGIRSGMFLGAGGVGGISFDQLAFPAKDLNLSILSLDYDRNAEDGYRMRLAINNHPVHVYLPDWLLVPIAKYAQSPYYSCVTLFGILHDKTLEKQVVDTKGRVINYHPSFNNTLLGIRLAYMDMLVGYPFANDLPKSNTDRYILGRGESLPDLQANRMGAYNLSQHIIHVENKYKLTFRSYVITDYTQMIDFNVVNDSLIITGSPYFFCWKYKSDNENYDIDKVAQEISAKYNQQLADLKKSPEKTSIRDWIIDELISQVKRYKDKYSFYSEGTFIDVVNLGTDTDRRQFLLRFESSSLFELVVKTEAYFDSYTIVNLEKFSREISSSPELFEAANPEVWNATVATLKYAAFFRYLKVQYPIIWKDFYNELKMIDPEPRIITPTIMFDPNIKVMQSAIRNLKTQ